MTTVSREELYELVWSEAMTKVGTRFEVSSSFLARVCTRMNVPRPPRGYWAQLAVGKAQPKPPLPPLRAGDESEWRRGGEPTAQVARVLPTPPDANAMEEQVRPVRRGLHALIATARQFFDGAKEAESGHLRPSKRRLVDLYVSASAIERALSLANRLFQALESQGHRVTLAPFGELQRPAVNERTDGVRDDYGYGKWSPDRPTVVYIGTVAIGLTLFEQSQEAELRYVDGQYLPVKDLTISQRLGKDAWSTWTTKRQRACGKLSLRAFSPYARAEWQRVWSESKKGELGPLIPSIVQELQPAATTVANLVAEGERLYQQQLREWQLQQERWELEERERRRAANVEASRDQLQQIVSAWSEATQIEAFFQDVVRRASELSEDDRLQVLTRVERARELLGGTNALARLSEWQSADERDAL